MRSRFWLSPILEVEWSPRFEIPDDGLTERERSRAVAKMAKLRAREKEKEDKKVARKQKWEEQRKKTEEH